MSRRRPKHRFLLTAWLFLPDHGHAIIDPPYPLTISRAMKAVKVSSMISLNQGRREAGEFWQGRCFHRALRTVKGYLETAEYIPGIPGGVAWFSVRRNGNGRASVSRHKPPSFCSSLVTRHLSLKRGGARRTREPMRPACPPTAGRPQAGLKIDPAWRDCQPMRTPASERRSRRPTKQVWATCFLLPRPIA